MPQYPLAGDVITFRPRRVVLDSWSVEGDFLKHYLELETQYISGDYYVSVSHIRKNNFKRNFREIIRERSPDHRVIDALADELVSRYKKGGS